MTTDCARYSTWRICALVLALLTAIAAAVSMAVLVPPLRSHSSILVGDRDWAAPMITFDGSVVRRSVLHCPVGECLVEHYAGPAAPMGDFRPLQNGDFAELVFEPGNPWFLGQNEGLCDTTFNCCSFAVGDLVGLTPGEWLGTTPTADGYPTPMAVILDSYFTLIGEMPVADALRDGAYDHVEKFQDRDVVCFEVSSATDDPLRREIIHAGQVRKTGSMNRLLSKFGQGPILLSDLRFPNRMFPGATSVRIYRVRS